MLFSLHRSVRADIRINELSPQTNPEWVELYNPDEETCALSGITLYFADTTDTTQKIQFCSGTSLSGKTYGRIVRPEGSYWLSNAGDTLLLKREDDVIDSVTFGNQLLKAPVGTQSAARNSEGVWAISDNPSPSGDVISFVCPTPTVTNTPVLTVTNPPTPAATNISSPTKIGVPSIQERPTSFVTIISTVEIEDEMASGEAVLGLTDEMPEPTVTPPDMLSQKRPYIAALLFVGIGLALLAAVSVMKIRYTKDI